MVGTAKHFHSYSYWFDKLIFLFPFLIWNQVFSKNISILREQPNIIERIISLNMGWIAFVKITQRSNHTRQSYWHKNSEFERITKWTSWWEWKKQLSGLRGSRWWSRWRVNFLGFYFWDFRRDIFVYLKTVLS